MSDTPPGWAENPSSLSQRWPLVAWALVGFAIAAYLSLYQWRIIPDVWEPFFGDGSRRVLDSPVSHILPIPDAALGALGYLADAVTGAIGGRRRWRTMPWMVLLFGLAAGPMGLVGVLLVVLQPVLTGSWCTLCLVSAAISVGIMSPSVDEALASLQYLRAEKKSGRSWWRAFWGRGGEPPETKPPREVPEFFWVPLIPAGLGLWLMAAPRVLNYQDAGRMNDWVVGPVVFSFGVMAVWEFMRPLRWVNVAVGAWMVLAAAFLYADAGGRISAALCGLAVAGFSVFKGRHRPALFGGGWRAAKPAFSVG